MQLVLLANHIKHRMVLIHLRMFIIFMKGNGCKTIWWKPRIKIHNPIAPMWFKMNSQISLLWQHKIIFCNSHFKLHLALNHALGVKEGDPSPLQHESIRLKCCSMRYLCLVFLLLCCLLLEDSNLLNGHLLAQQRAYDVQILEHE